MVFEDHEFNRFSSSPVSLLPPLVALTLAILTRRVLISLGVGIVLGAVLLNSWSVGDTAGYVGTQVSSVFVEDGGLNTWNMSIVGFLILLGMTTALLTLSGGTRAFAEWAQSRVKSSVAPNFLLPS